MGICFLFCITNSALALDSNQEVLIEAASGVDYDMEKNITTANQNVKLTRGNITVYADRVVYYGNSGLVEADGNVRLQNPAGEYHTEKLLYNVFDSTGSLSAFTATLDGKPRDFQFKGQGIEMQSSQSVISNVAVTRCSKPQPDYTLNAKTVKIVGTKVKLKHVILKVKGIPLFYFPILSFYTDQGMPELEPGYNDTDGIMLKGNWVLSTSKKSEWSIKGDLRSKGDESVLGVGNVTRFKNSNNQFDILYDLDGWWKLRDTYTYDTRWAALTVDGYRNFSNEEKYELGLRLNRKYWTTPVGDWQFSLLARKMGAYDSAGKDDYYGIYTGFQLDYRINSNARVSLMHLDKVSGDFRELIEDYNIGSNALYDVNVPLNGGVSLNFNGTYNFDESKWYHQIYSISRDTCCFRPTIYYDGAEHSWGGRLTVKF